MSDQEDEMDAAGGPMGAMVTALTWVKRGYAKPLLDCYEPDDA
jgi:hypothetical protein